MGTQNAARIAALNDALRKNGRGGRVMITNAVNALGPISVVQIRAAVARFADFSRDNDPNGEHDFGAVEVGGEKVFFKIDYYDNLLEYASPDPADPAVTTRVLTIMLAADY